LIRIRPGVFFGSPASPLSSAGNYRRDVGVGVEAEKR
jgi:hypothetical protein